MGDVTIEDLSARMDLIPLLARWHFEQWGNRSGAATESEDRAMLNRNAMNRNLPLTLIAVSQDRLLGSVTIVECDMDIRAELKPWIGQLYVDRGERGRGIGSALVRAAVERSGKLGFRRVYLYTSGTLPNFYERIGWTWRENVHDRDKNRTAMEIKLYG